MKYALFNESGMLVTRLIAGINDIPSDAVEVSEELWIRITQEVDGIWQIDADGTIFKADLPPPSYESLVAAAAARRDVMLRDASVRMGPLQDAVALGNSTPEEDAELRLWMEHRVLLNRLQQQPGYPAEIQWPPAPGE